MSIASFALMSTISNLVCSRSGYLCVAALCLVINIDLLLADILLYHLLFLDNLLAQTDLLFYHRALLDYDLFLDDGYPDLVIPGLRLGYRRTLFNRNAFDTYLLTLFGDNEALAVGPHLLANAYAPGLAFASTSPKLLLDPLHPKLVLASKLLTTLAVRVAPRHTEPILPGVLPGFRKALSRPEVDPLGTASIGVVRQICFPFRRRNVLDLRSVVA